MYQSESNGKHHFILVMSLNQLAKKSFAAKVFIIATMILFTECSAAEASGMSSSITRPRSIETACSHELAMFCPGDADSAISVAAALPCLQALPSSKIRSVCAAWVHAYAACDAGLRRRGSACDLSRVTIQQCMRDVPFQELPEACVTHDIFHQAKALCPGRRGKTRV